MRNTLLALAAALVAACTDDVRPTDESGRDTTDVRATPPDEALDRGRESVCDRTVATDGACADPCNPDKLLEFIPPGTCVLFECELDDGSYFRTGGCNT